MERVFRASQKVRRGIRSHKRLDKDSDTSSGEERIQVSQKVERGFRASQKVRRGIRSHKRLNKDSDTSSGEERGFMSIRRLGEDLGIIHSAWLSRAVLYIG